MSAEDCPDPYHDGDPGETYQITVEGSDWVTEGYRCPTCKFESVTVSYFHPVDRACTRCGTIFGGANPEDPNDNRCSDCFGDDVKRYIDAMIASRELEVDK